MNTNKLTDWMLVTVTKYDTEKGYIYGKKHDTGAPVIIAKKNNVRFDWNKSISNPNLNTHAPVNSVLAVFGASEIDSRTGFNVASWATPVSKRPQQEDLFVTPIKVMNQPRIVKNNSKSKKDRFIDAIVMDSRPLTANSVEEMRDACLQVLDKDCSTAFDLDGPRGFMIRIGHSDGNLADAKGWEFFGRINNAPADTWNYYWNQSPQKGMQYNKLKAILHSARKVMQDPHGYIEIVGLSKVTVNDFGSIEKVNELAALPNYKTDYNNKEVPAYSLAAFTVEKQGKQRIIKQQFPLPNKKVVNHIAGILGNHAPKLNKKITTAVSNNGTKVSATSAKPTAQPKQNPLTIEDFINETGEVVSIHVTGTPNNLNKYRKRIENAAASISPLIVRNGQAFSFPVKYKNVISASLSDLTGAPAIFLDSINIHNEPHIVLVGRIHEEPYASGIRNFLQKNNLSFAPGKPIIIPENMRISLVNGIKDLLNKPSNIPAPQTTSAKNQIAKQPPSKPANKKAPQKKRISYSDWQQSKFGKNPGIIMGFLDADIRAYAEEAGIDWDRSQSSVIFGAPGQKGELIKAGVEPLKKSHKSSVAISAKVFETKGKQGNDSTISFTLTFFNKMAESSKEPYSPKVTFNSYEYAFDEYMREMDLGVSSTKLGADLEELKRANEAREAEALAKAKKEQEKATQSRLSWGRKFHLMPKEDGSDAQLIKKGISNVANSIDIRRGQDQFGKFIAYQLFSIGVNYMGIQQIYNNPISNEKGKVTNKKFIHGTLFKDAESDQYYGTHALVGEITPDKPIYFCEGLSDAGTGNELTNCPFVICLNKGNMDAVIHLFREKYPEKRFIIVSDNDAYNIVKGNGGFCSAIEAARKYDAEYILPNFDGLSTESNPTDINDLRALAGDEKTRAQILSTQKPNEDLLEHHKQLIQHVGTESLKAKLETAVKSIVSNGKHGTNSEQIHRMLAMRAVMAYGNTEVAKALGDSANNLFEIVESQEPTTPPEPPTQADKRFPVTLTEKENKATGKKYLLIVDHTYGDHQKRIGAAIKKIVGPSHLPFNETLKGWVVPNTFQRVISSYLHDITGASQLYIGRSRSKSSGTHFVVRGDFSNKEFKRKIHNLISYTRPEFIETDFGFLLPDNKALPYIRESIKEYLTPRSNVTFTSPFQKTEIQEPAAFNSSAMKEAQRVSGLTNSEITFAHYRLVFNEKENIFLDDDFVFSSIYGRAIKGFSNLEPDAQHQKALEESRRNVRNLLATGLDSDVLSPESTARLEEIVTHLELLLDKNQDKPEFNATEIKAIEATSSDSNLSTEGVIAFISGNKNDLSEERRTCIRSYQKHLLNLYRELEVVPEEETALINIDKIEQHPLREHSKRVNELLDLTRTIVEKGFDEEELYDLFLTQKNSPYFNEEKGGFQKDLFNRDLKHLSTSSNIDGWTPTKVSTASGLYAVIHNDIAKNRLCLLEEYVNAYLEEKSDTTYKSFSKYFHGEYSLKSNIMHPYFDEDEVNEETLSRDLEYLTGYASVAAFYRSAVDEYIGKAVQGSLFEEEVEQKPVSKHGKLNHEIIKETSSDKERVTVSKYALDEIQIFEVTAQKNNKGVWETQSHDFSNDLESANEVLNMSLNNEAQSKNHNQSLPVNKITSDKAPSNEIHHLEIDNGDSNIYAIVEEENIGGVWEQQTVSLWSDYALASKSYQQLYKERIEKFQEPEVTNNEQIKILRSSKPVNTDAKIISKTIKGWAKENYSTDDVLKKLEHELNIKLASHDKNLISEQYNQMVEKYRASDITTTERASNLFDELHAETIALVKSDLTYDEYIDEFFKVDGSLIDRNPYYDAQANTVNKKQAFEDMRAAGYKSIFQFYESNFEGVHHRSSNDVVIGRIGGFIPDQFNELQPVRPQFQSIQNILSSNQANVDVLPPFKEWINSLDKVRAIHPILSEDLLAVNAKELTSQYSRDEILLLADIHGVSVAPEDHENRLAERVIWSWKTRSMFAEMSYDETKDLHVDTLVDLMKDMGLPTNGKHLDRVDRALAHIEKLKAISELRIAQYSYIRTAIEIEESNKKIPSYALKDISTFISNEIEFKASADESILRTSKASLRKRIDLCAGLIFPEIDPVTRTVLSESNKDANIVGAPGTDYINLGKYKYYIHSDYDTDKLMLPKSVAYHATFGDKVFATPTPLDSHYMLSNSITPLSKDAISHSSSPIAQWMDTYGYAAFRQNDGETLHVAYKNNASWMYDTYKNGDLINSKSYTNAKKLLDQNLLNLDSFVDRDFICEEYLTKFNPTTSKTINDLDAIATSIIERESLSAIDLSNVSDPKILNYLDKYNKEDLDIQIHRVCQELVKDIKENALACVFEKNKEPDTDTLRSAERFITAVNLNAPQEEQKLDVPSKPLWQYSPSEACKIYAESTNSNTPSSTFTPYIESHYNCLSPSQKNEIGLDIASGTYESIGHYLHERALKDAALNHNADAITAYQQYYPEESSSSEPITKEHKPSSQFESGSCVFLTSKSGESAFGIVTDYSDGKIKYQPTTSNNIDLEKLPPMVRKDLVSEDGTYLFALSFDQFKERPEAAIPLQDNLNIDPCSSSGRTKLQKLPLVELSEYTKIIGGNYKVDRPSMLNSIDSIVNAKIIVEKALKNNKVEFTPAEKTTISEASGIDINSNTFENEATKWNKDVVQHSLVCLAEQNYNKIQSLATQYNISANSLSNSNNQAKEVKTSINDFSDIRPFDFNQSTSFYLRSTPSVKQLLTDVNSTDLDKKANATWALNLLNTDAKKLEENIKRLPAGYSIIPTIEQNEVVWFISDKTGKVDPLSASSSPEDTLNTRKSIPSLDEIVINKDSLIAWKDPSNQIMFGWAAKNTSLCEESVACIHKDNNGHEYVCDIPAENTVQVNEQLWDTISRNRINKVDGEVSNLVSHFENEQKNISKINNLYTQALEAYVCKSAAEHVNLIKSAQDKLPDTVRIAQCNGMYEARQDGQTTSPSQFTTLSELVESEIINNKSEQIQLKNQHETLNNQTECDKTVQHDEISGQSNDAEHIDEAPKSKGMSI